MRSLRRRGSRRRFGVTQPTPLTQQPQHIVGVTGSVPARRLHIPDAPALATDLHAARTVQPAVDRGPVPAEQPGDFAWSQPSVVATGSESGFDHLDRVDL